MKFVVKDLQNNLADPVGNSNSVNIDEFDIEELALFRVRNAPLNKILEEYNNATDI